MRKIRVLCVDDSALIRKLLTKILNADPGIEVVGTAADPIIARQKIKQLNPDVLTLDIEMPRMDGLTFLEKLMRLRPMPVVMVSTLTSAGGSAAVRALSLGAVDVIGKPQTDLAQTFEALAEEVRTKVKAAAKARLHSAAYRSTETEGLRLGVSGETPELIVIGASTGGTEATYDLLSQFPAGSPPILIAQHIPANFSRAYAGRLNELENISASEAQDGSSLQPGHAYVAPGDFHMTLTRVGAELGLRVSSSERVNQSRPSVDVLFESVAKAVGGSATGVLLTGMGEDGARGLLKLKEAGARTVVQDEKTSIVWGMPGSAVRLGATETVLPLPQIAEWVFSN